MREHDAEREHRPEVIDEAGGEDDLAEFGLVEPGLDHHRVDDRDRGRGQRDAGDLRLRPRPVDDAMGVGQHPEVRRDEAHDADRHARPEMLPDDARIDFRPGEKGQQDGAEAGEKIDPVGDVKADEVAGESAHHDFDQRDGYGDPDRNQRRDQRQSEPQRRLKPDTCHAAFSRSRRSWRGDPARRTPTASLTR